MGNKTDLFSEIYGCYFTVVARILEQAQTGISRTEMEQLVNSNAFSDTAFYLLPRLFSGEWNLLEQKEDGLYYTRLLSSQVKRSMTTLEKSWLKALLSDKRILLFITTEQRSALETFLSDIPPLFLPDDFHIFDLAADGDPYESCDYQTAFRTILNACVLNKPLSIEYNNGKQKPSAFTVLPYKLSYSSRDDKFRLLGVLLRHSRPHNSVTLNLARILSVKILDLDLPEIAPAEKYFRQSICKEPITLEISKERNALERSMLQFASWEKQTEYDPDGDSYLCRIYFDKQDETELLIRILSFGPVVKVLGPPRFLKQVKERIHQQYQLNLS